VACRESKHDCGPTLDQGTEDDFCILRVDTAVADHRHATTMGREVGLRGTVGDEARQGNVPGIRRTIRIQVDDERRPGCCGQRKRANSAENLVLRRPDGERRHSQTPGDNREHRMASDAAIQDPRFTFTAAA
jgi:hypothetical protein